MGWFYSLEGRDRRALLAAIVTLVVGGFYFLLWAPQVESRDALRQSVEQQRETLTWMRNAASEVKLLQKGAEQTSKKGGSASLLGLIDRTARSATLSTAVTRMEPQGQERVRIWLTGADFDKVIAWLGKLRKQHGVRVITLDFERDEGPGRVGGRLSLGYSEG